MKTYSKDSLNDLTNESALLEHVSATMVSRYRDAVRVCVGGLEHFKLPTDADKSHDLIGTLH